MVKVAPGELAASGDAAAVCTFSVVQADFLRSFKGQRLPFFHELRAKGVLSEMTLTYPDVVSGKHVGKFLSVSHRWMTPEEPDPDGEQLKAIKAFLASDEGREFEHVWIDAQSMPQDTPAGSRSAEDTKAFMTMLSQVNMLYLGTSVLILLDLSYVSRFWTQFEAWLSMQFATPKGLKPAVGTKNARHHVVCIQNAAAQSELYSKALVDNWAKKTPEEAHDFLSKPDVTVTNQSDKDGQLPKIKGLDETAKGAFNILGQQHEQRVAASAAAAKSAKAELDKFEKANDAKTGKSNPLFMAAKETEAEAESARQAKDKHAQAIKLGVMPIVMDREEGRQLAEASRKAEEEVRQQKAEERERQIGFAARMACCCMSEDGAHVYHCLPTKDPYILPCCLHMVLCPQQRCDPQCNGKASVPLDRMGCSMSDMEAHLCLNFGAIALLGVCLYKSAELCVAVVEECDK